MNCLEEPESQIRNQRRLVSSCKYYLVKRKEPSGLGKAPYGIASKGYLAWKRGF